MTSPNLRGLYALTPDELDTGKLLRLCEAALEGGLGWLQYRNKRADAALRVQQASGLQVLCAAHGARLIVNDFPLLAAQVGAAGVHVGREDGAIGAARERVGEAVVGASCYNELQRALDAAQQGADYVAFGSFFLSSTKPDAVRTSVDLLRAARAQIDIPIVAIGGITLDNAPALIAAGADAVAVSSALFGAPDVSATARAFNHLFGSS